MTDEHASSENQPAAYNNDEIHTSMPLVNLESFPSPPLLSVTLGIVSPVFMSDVGTINPHSSIDVDDCIILQLVHTITDISFFIFYYYNAMGVFPSTGYETQRLWVSL
jgi:hypothetical protein